MSKEFDNVPLAGVATGSVGGRGRGKGTRSLVGGLGELQEPRFDGVSCKRAS